MLANQPIGNIINMNIGTVIVYSVLFIQCIYSYWIRSPKQINRTLHLTFIVSLFGVLNGALFWGSRSFITFHQLGQIQMSGMFFGFAVTPLTWMVGLCSFSIILKEFKRPVQILLAYILAFFHFALIITYVALVTAASSYAFDAEYLMSLLQAAKRILTGTLCLNWGYFLLFLWLIIQHRKSLSKKMMATLIIFAIMNTVSLILVIAILAAAGDVDVWTFLLVLFVFGDLLPALSLYMTTSFWRDINQLEEQ